jgi:hypothetical protein
MEEDRGGFLHDIQRALAAGNELSSKVLETFGGHNECFVEKDLDV